jgi:ribonuclease HI
MEEYGESPMQENESKEVWVLHTDGASNEEGNGVGLILDSPDGVELTYALKLSFKTSNNEAKYEALIAVLRMAHKMGIRYLQVFMDSMLVVNQINQTYKAKEQVWSSIFKRQGR